MFAEELKDGRKGSLGFSCGSLSQAGVSLNKHKLTLITNRYFRENNNK